MRRTITYHAKFITQLSPLICLLEQNSKWEWYHEQTNYFTNLKKTITEELLLRFYNTDKSTRISADVSQFGLEAVLLQQHVDTWQPITYTSRALTEASRASRALTGASRASRALTGASRESRALTGAETRYAEIEKELLASTYLCNRFYQ